VCSAGAVLWAGVAAARRPTSARIPMAEASCENLGAEGAGASRREFGRLRRRGGGGGRLSATKINRPVDHERSYRGLSPRAFLHRARRGAILRMLRENARGPAGRLADFGCSNGFVLGLLRSDLLRAPGWELWGFDHAPHYIEEARGRGISGARFELFDLDAPDAEPPGLFDAVLCLETLEHTGNYRVGLRNLARAVRPGGILLVSVPKE